MYAVAMVVHRLLAYFSAVPPRTTLRDDLLMGAALIAGAAVMQIRWLLSTAAMLLVGAVVATVWPNRAVTAFTVSTLAMVLTMALGWSRRGGARTN
jgi:hypothetical protein